MAKKKVKAAAKEARPTFEEARDAVEAIVRQLEEGSLGLSDSLATYEEGIQHLKLCYQILEEAERKIETLVRLGEDGVAVTTEFDDEQISLEEKAESRGRRRTASPKISAPRKTRSPRGDGDSDDRVDENRSLF